MTRKHVLIVGDDEATRGLIGDFLASHAFDVSTAADGGATTRILNARPVDLVLLDLQLAREDGFELMRRIIVHAYAPVICLAGHQNGELDKVLALELGADDCMTKPPGLRELLARIRTSLRRAERSGCPPCGRRRRLRYQFAGWELDTRGRCVAAPDGDSVKLTSMEFNLLITLLRAPQQPLSREQLIAGSRVHDDGVFDRSVDVLILRLRRKLEPDPKTPRLIRTERGAGYMLAAPVRVL